MVLPFWKLTGAGNDFIAINNLTGKHPDNPEERAAWIRVICARKTGVGADGVLFLESCDEADFRMRYYNADGGEADTCGNGARCIARFARLLGVVSPTMRFLTNAGIYEAEVLPDEEARVTMGPVTGLKTDIALKTDSLPSQALPKEWADKGKGLLHFADSGVPHLMMETGDVENLDVDKLGRALRHHELFQPAGANVNFVEIADQNTLRIRTYERGVEGETLACGTGSIASAVILAHQKKVQSPVRLITRSGLSLTVSFTLTGDGARGVSLEGEARVVYRGEWYGWPLPPEAGEED